MPLVDLIRDARAQPADARAGHGGLPDHRPGHRARRALLHNLKHNRVLHEQQHRPERAHRRRSRASTTTTASRSSACRDDFSRVILTFGYMETPNIPKALALARRQGLKFDIMATSFFLGRRSIEPAAKSAMPLWQDKLFIFLVRHATNATDFFNIPAGRVVELGTQVTI